MVHHEVRVLRRERLPRPPADDVAPVVVDDRLCGDLTVLDHVVPPCYISFMWVFDSNGPSFDALVAGLDRLLEEARRRVLRGGPGAGVHGEGFAHAVFDGLTVNK